MAIISGNFPNSYVVKLSAIHYLVIIITICDFIVSCPCTDTSGDLVRSVCFGPSTAPCMCSSGGCTVSV